jgi:hypothetical protein
MAKRPAPKRRRLLAAMILAVLALLAAALLWIRWREARRVPPVYGVTFSTKYAGELGLDWREAFLAALDDLEVRRFRLPVYWDEIEPQRGQERWDDLDWMLSEAGKRDAQVILAIGRKVPRWPECHVPAWAAELPEDVQRGRLLSILERIVRRYRGAPAVRMWQVENEPLFHFGRCPPPDREFLKREVELVKSLDARPVMVTDSGELSTWIRTATVGDVLGISMYRLVWNKYVGELYWPVSPLYYTERMNLLSPVVRTVIVSELQAEPWFRKPPDRTPLEEQFEGMDVARLRENAAFAESIGVSEIYFWGVEWWYWLRGRGHEGFWEAARPYFVVE